ncbi:MAG TPA: hypothetical protein VGV39_30075 [Mesorhizobium sp.]|jgi:hypothetical protein|uniref:hypothetical protein n=1 Tax=Mesorhizobium sp. TaxID=1871066 RepID=UPI002DDD27A1|nr:hypothetical protein [Mesorhizobium sp.]HEV2507358.1 hypothetical protein [Mesorhizobium sp.]
MDDAESDAKPRFMTDEQLRKHFGLSERALSRLRASPRFPRKDGLILKTDRRAVDKFFDARAGINSPSLVGNSAGIDGEENFG